MELHDRLLDETLSDEEHDELLGLIEIIEKADADRLKHLIELAQLRNTTLDALMDQLVQDVANQPAVTSTPESRL
jgi:hypothetical protein